MQRKTSKLIHTLASGSSTVVGHLTSHPEVEGSSPVEVRHQEKVEEEMTLYRDLGKSARSNYIKSLNLMLDR
jgi:hypothetical protein